MATSVSVTQTNNADIDGLLSGVKWSGVISYSFPDSPSDYPSSYSGGSSEPTTSGFASAPSQMQAAINYAIGLIQSYTNASITYNGANSADIMIAQSPSANPTSYAYYPGNYAAGGDVWFGTDYDYTQAKLGNYYFTTALHELGHAFGLKHSQETGGVANVAVPSAHDDSEYTVMSYRSYVGASTTAGYTNEAYGYPQTYMANDILALQTMYGANYTTQSGSTVYTWSPTTGQEFINGVGQLAPGGGVGGSANRIYETVWDGGGVDTYDLSNYTTNLSINLNPGASSVFSTAQLAYLGDGHYASGNVYNAYLYNGDARSYIDNATGGSGNDTILGNAIANVLNGGSGNDTITGGGGNDTIVGGSGADTAVYSGNRANYGVTYNASTDTFTLTDLRSGSPDGVDTATGIEAFQFADGTITSATLLSQVGPVTIEALGATSLVQSGGNYFLDAVAGGTGPTLKLSGAAVTQGQLGAWTPIAVEATSTGYEVAWKYGSSGSYSVWQTDSNGNYISGSDMTSTSIATVESSFHQDLNGDGVITPASTSSTTIEAFGSTSLVLTGNNYYLNPVSGGTGPTLKLGGAALTQGQLGAWTPIGAEATSSGYEVAWKYGSSGSYSVWHTDSSGNYVSGSDMTSASIATVESSFHQDLNGDGVITAANSSSSTTIEALGSTSLVLTGSNYFLNPVSGGTGPTLKLGGAAMTQGQLGAWAPIGAEATSSGYEVAWKYGSSGSYSVWQTDSNGNYVSGSDMTSTSIATVESSFHQDLNGDGVITPTSTSSTTIEALGSTSLVLTGSNYYLNPVAGGTGPTLKLGGAAMTQGQLGAWTPIGAEATSSGYEVAWKYGSGSSYSVWQTDSNGNYLSGSDMTPTSIATVESSFHQDLNGDGVIGASPASGMASTPGDSFLFRSSPPVTVATETTSSAGWVSNDSGQFANWLAAQSASGHVDTSFLDQHFHIDAAGHFILS
ncbi:M10 family metallopeptidase C-terminal domain-containing protein [Bradyrhizobium diazoefficiens]|uniref:M10 family metallopeptidase C-terminal domain-containing protein n=1 Tax=Bradyrhizobium diazoefficiens TaxID=1355477 RepID=UPI001FF038CA|nr:M10 family metallopeptidase C-terminal domain-containing protein [Bradyrhizobium diazoefficiens]